MNPYLHSDESKYAQYLLLQIGLIEKRIHLGNKLAPEEHNRYYNFLFELCRLTQPAMESIFKVENGHFYA